MDTHTGVSSTLYARARAFIWRNARPLDLARWRFHFEGGPAEDVLTALAHYANADGGLGHAVEPDVWNPNSTPIQTWAAIEILREIGWTDAGHPLVQGILRYLTGGQDFDGQYWEINPESNNQFPHAPWWHSAIESAGHHTYNPTACLAGFLLRFSLAGSDPYLLGARVARAAVDAYMAGALLDDMHLAACYVGLCQDIRAAGGIPGVNLGALEDKLRRQVTHSITGDTAQWETGHICKPSQFFHDRESVFYADNAAMADYECAFILRTQLPDGSWLIPWSWAEYPEACVVSKHWLRSHGIIGNLRFLKGMGRLVA